MNYPKGSVWRKWDLHVHSPESVLENKFRGASKEEKWNNYLECLEQLKDVAVIGVTDYFTVDGYVKAKKFKDNGRLGNIDMLLPNVELRLELNTKAGRAINLHVLFHPSIINLVKDVFFPNLKFSYSGNDYSCTRTDLIRLGRAFKRNESLGESVAFKEGVKQFKVSIKNLKEVFKDNDGFCGKYLIAIANKETDGNSGIRDDSLRALREDLYRFANCIFSGRPKDREYFLGNGVDSKENIIKNYGSLKPCIHGSDAHDLDSICVPNQDRFTWIKADPTFEGLKQILFEPESRVCIQKDSPVLEFPKPHFSSFKASGGIFDDDRPCFQDCSIPLNRNLVALIGGRGTGKSLLLDVMYRTFHDAPTFPNTKQNRLARIGSPEFEITLTKSDGEESAFKHNDGHSSFEYLHVRQGEVKEVAEDKEKLAEAIKELLGFIQSKSCRALNESISELNKEHNELQKWIEETDKVGNKVNSKDFQNRRKKDLRMLISMITTKDTKDKITSFSENSSQIGKLNKANSDVLAFKDEITRTTKKLNEQIDYLNGKMIGIHVEIEGVNLSATVAQLDEYSMAIKKRLMQLEENNLKISKDLLKKGIKGDISGLLDKVNEYQQGIETCNSVLEENGKTEERLASIFKQRVVLADKIICAIEEESASFANKFSEIAAGSPSMTDEHKKILGDLLKNIEISGEVLFDKDKFFDGLNEYFNGRKIRKDSLKEVFPIRSVKDYYSLLRNEPIIRSNEGGIEKSLTEFARDTKCFSKKELYEFFDYIYAESSRREYLQVIPSIKYFGKEPHQLSVGQRGTFYICLKLATSAFLAPFVFDQPEDDLDNAFIVKELEPIFRKIKKYRQVIIVTHNANLVVNSDAEQVIIASNENEEISYCSGSLECPQIRDKVCKILEGGPEAFKKRERRYELS
ncbi:TrlF family AAA-like ATPase [Desulfobaculum bizertense]|uniref:Uncharacterized protein n=1 Tax=Desulfobaculum bizertense DSM 18034 TaxID=1121442 RepID=A0A1T4WWS3_9BACT|nr:hypothetical protein [Desulfobaculum bizertense]SKA81793.1 hypothetical protein SAMN02745702_02759 [Desulfobaculum bizertense DSM 18034]